MNPISVVWDVQFTGESVTEKDTADTVLLAVRDYIQHPIAEVMNHNQLHQGQKVSRSGFTTGLRFIIDATFLSADEISNLNEMCISFKHELTDLSSVSIGELLPIPLDLRTKSRFPVIGRMMLCIDFTNGLGYDDAKSIRAAMNNQTKDTKNGLDPTSIGKGSSGKLFSESFRSILSDPWWMRTFAPRGEISSGMLRSADGGCYDLSFDLRNSIEELVEISEGEWWNSLDPQELTLSPKLIFDPTNALDSDFDPANFYHLDHTLVYSHKEIDEVLSQKQWGKLSEDDRVNFDELSEPTEKAIEIEESQTGDESIMEEIRYTLRRVRRGRRNRKQLGIDHGLAHGVEDFVISEHAIRPWFAEEFVNSLAFFIMTRKPKFWRNGKSRLIILQPFSREWVEALKDD